MDPRLVAPLTEEELSERLGELSVRILLPLESTNYSWSALPRQVQVGPLNPLVCSVIARRNTLGWQSLTVERARQVICQRHRNCFQRSLMDSLRRIAEEVLTQMSAVQAPGSPANDLPEAAEEQEERRS